MSEGTQAAPGPDGLQAGLAAHRAGDLEQAERLYRAFLDAHPAHPGALHLLGLIAHQRGDHEQAAARIREALTQRPDEPFFHNNLGEALRARGDLEGALAAYREAVRLKPDYAQAHHNLGLALHRSGRLEEAVAAYQAALAGEPRVADVHNHLAIALAALGRADQAIDRFRAALALTPEHAQACHNLALTLRERGESGALMEARELAARAAGLAPESAAAAWNLAVIELRLGRPQAAEVPCRRALSVDPANAECWLTLEESLRGQGRLDEAIEAAREALRIDPTLARAQNDLGVSLAAKGETEAAMAALERAIELDPEQAIAYENLSRARRFTASDGELLERVEKLAGRAELGDLARASAHFAAAKMHDDLDRVEAAFEHLRAANEIRRRSVEWSADGHDAWVRRLAAVFTRELVSRLEPLGDPSETPVFILGMPRSGTTLVEQILASHPEVHGAGELTHFYEFTQSLQQRLGTEAAYPECVRRLDASVVRWMASTYLERVRALAPEARRITDKLPVNFLHLGLIAVTFPRARIVHCVRDPMAVGFSLYRQNFQQIRYAYDLYEIGRFVRQYRWLMAHWHGIFPGRLFEVAYEETVADPERAARALVAHLGLDWDARCLRFQETPRFVTTASTWQVRAPVYTDSVAAWRRYERFLGPLKAGLGEAGR